MNKKQDGGSWLRKNITPVVFLIIGAISFFMLCFELKKGVDKQFNKVNNLYTKETVGEKVNKLVIKSNGFIGFCSSFDLTDDKTIQLTAAHCVEEKLPTSLLGMILADELAEPTIDLYSSSFKKMSDFIVLYKNDVTDVAILGKKGTRPKNVIKLQTPRNTEFVYAVGYPGITAGRDFVISKGLFLGAESIDSRLSGIFRTTAIAKQGMSGGPTFNEFGELLGVNSNVYAMSDKDDVQIKGGFIVEFDILGLGIAGFNSVKEAVEVVNDRFFK